MSISAKVEYGLRAILEISQNEGLLKARELSERMNIPLKFLAHIINDLSVAGITISKTGAKGGVSLAKDPGQISLKDVIEALDGPFKFLKCDAIRNWCGFTENCPIKNELMDVEQKVEGILESKKISDFLCLKDKTNRKGEHNGDNRKIDNQ
ncbi:MAG: Rrf2 family transcriptional regulator [Actinobacteria bacterium]|nr:Rrf2 family transcriptional regulator [Actinomycetota bacterium]